MKEKFTTRELLSKMEQRCVYIFLRERKIDLLRELAFYLLSSIHTMKRPIE
jgi:hypothetical protein